MIKPENQNIELRLRSERDRVFWINEIGLLETGGTFCLSLWTTLRDPISGRRGEFYTTLPIAPLAYRLENQPSWSKIVQLSPTCLTIYDDWGSPHTIATDAAIVSALVEEAKQYQLYKPAEVGG